MSAGKLNPRVFTLVNPDVAVVAVAQAGGAPDEITLNAGDAGVNDQHNGKFITIIAGPGQGESRRVLDNISISKLAKVDRPWITHPDGGSTYVLAHGLTFESQDFVVTSASPNSVTLNNDQGAVVVADWYNNLLVEVIKGTGKGKRMIMDHTGATRVLQIAGLWKVQPVAGDIVRVQGHLYFPNKGLVLRSSAGASIALRPGGSASAAGGLVSMLNNVWPEGVDSKEAEHVPYIELPTAVTYTLQRWE